MLGEGESGMKEKKIMIVEPSPIVQEGLKNIIQRIQDFTVDAFYFDTNRLTEHLLARIPDLLLFNPCLLDPSSRRNIRQLYGINDECSLVAIEYSFVDKEIRDQFDAEISINDNDTRIQNKLQALKRNEKTERKNESEELTDRENEILVAIARGLTNKEIAEKYYISIHTVISHRKNIVKKTGIKSVSGLTVYALLNNLISYNDID
jgi:DNA-binding NarL/FixJ family response regulator